MPNRYNEHFSISAYDLISELHNCHLIRSELVVILQGDLLSFADMIIEDKEKQLWDELQKLMKQDDKEDAQEQVEED